MLAFIVPNNFTQKRIYSHPLKILEKQAKETKNEKKRKDRKEGKTNPKHNKSLEYLCCSLLKMRLTDRTSTEDKP